VFGERQTNREEEEEEEEEEANDEIDRFGPLRVRSLVGVDREVPSAPSASQLTIDCDSLESFTRSF
jgi:hypothetical protein